MWGLENLGIPYNAADGTVTLPLWAAAAAAGLVLVLFVLALIRTGLAGTLVFLALVAFGGWAAWSWMEHERLAERHTLEARISALEAQALAPNSALACLDGAGGDTVENACAKSLFASPEASASGVSYTAARLALLADGQNFVARQDPSFDSALDHLRSGLELDRFGFVAHVLALRRGCTPDKCDALRMFRDPNRIRSNLAEKAFDGHLLRAAAMWSERPTARAPAPANTGVATPLPPNYNLPSSASIPPVSIMTAEPPAATAPPPSQAQAATPPPAARRPATPPQRRPPPRPPADNSAASPPVQLQQPGTTRVQ